MTLIFIFFGNVSLISFELQEILGHCDCVDLCPQCHFQQHLDVHCVSGLGAWRSAL